MTASCLTGTRALAAEDGAACGNVQSELNEYSSLSVCSCTSSKKLRELEPHILTYTHTHAHTHTHTHTDTHKYILPVKKKFK